MARKTLYPPIQPYREFKLEVTFPHMLHVEACGRSDGLPVVCLHGGPGGRSEPFYRRFFDPERYCIILFDQRGCGRSTPHAELTGNTTQALIADIEHLRKALHIKRWLIFGGSWGATLALAYAQRYPQRVMGLILRGVFLCRACDIHWFYQDGACRLFPDLWQEFLAPIPPDERTDLIHAYHRRLTGTDEVARMAAAKAWATWEGRLATLVPNSRLIEHFADPHFALTLAQIECYYFVNDCFLTENQLLTQAGRLKNIPGVIVHGRYDVICPLEQALALHQVWPAARLEVVPMAGHAASEPGITDALVRATNEMAERFF